MADTDKSDPTPPLGEGDNGPGRGEELEKQFFDGEERALRDLKEESEREAARETAGAGKEEDWVDGEDELRRIMAPKKSARHPILAILVIGASLYGLWWLRDDMMYFLRGRSPQSLGQATVAAKEGRLEHNTYVTLQGMPLSQSVASYKMRSLFGGSRDRRTQWFLLAGTGNQVLVSQTVHPVDPRSRTVPQTSDQIRGVFTGRLRLLRRTDFDKRVRSDYLRLSKQSPMLRPFHRVAAAEVLGRAGSPGAELKDVEGETFRVHADTLLELFVTFPGEYELDIHTDQKDEIKADIQRGEKIPPLAVAGGDGAPTCGPPQPWPPGGATTPAPAGPATPATVQPGPATPAPGGATSAQVQPRPAVPSPRPAAAPAHPTVEPPRPAAGAAATAQATPTRRSGWGGSLYFRFDPKLYLLDHLPQDRTIEARSGLPGDPPESAADRVIALPEGTKVFNAKARDCKQACRWEGPGCLKGCSTAPHIEITPVGKQVFVAAGGDCGGGKGERHEVNLSVLPFPDAKRAEAFVESLGHPYLMTEDLSGTSHLVRFIVKLPEEAARDLIKRQRKSSPYNIAPRFEVFRVRWQHLAREGKDLLITRTLRGYPQEHEVEVRDGKRRLRPVPVGATLRVAASRVVKADVTQLLKLPRDAYVLEVGVKPSDMWMQPFLPGVPVFYLLLALFIVLNLMAIRSHFRK